MIYQHLSDKKDGKNPQYKFVHRLRLLKLFSAYKNNNQSLEAMTYYLFSRDLTLAAALSQDYIYQPDLIRQYIIEDESRTSLRIQIYN